MSAANFMRAWDNGDRWALVVLRPGELPAAPVRQRYLEAAAAFERVAAHADSAAMFTAAATQWPDEPIAWIGRGTARYRQGDLSGAAWDYRKALAIDGTQAAARNNLAMTLLDLGCPAAARVELARIDVATLSGTLQAAVADTREQIDARRATPERQGCADQ
jgi:Tfp pilus assembly protein PilF